MQTHFRSKYFNERDTLGATLSQYETTSNKKSELPRLAFIEKFVHD